MSVCWLVVRSVGLSKFPINMLAPIGSLVQTLQRLAHETVRNLMEEDGCEDARTAVQDILTQIYQTVFTAQEQF